VPKRHTSNEDSLTQTKSDGYNAFLNKSIPNFAQKLGQTHSDTEFKIDDEPRKSLPGLKTFLLHSEVASKRELNTRTALQTSTSYFTSDLS
jgi:hypothetical protein